MKSKCFYVFKNGIQQGKTITREQAVGMIRVLQKQENLPFLKAQFSLIEGEEEEFIPYRSCRKRDKAKSEHKISRQITENETETELGKYQTWIYLKSGRGVEICNESDELSKDDWFYSIRLYCSEKEFRNNEFCSTGGIVYQETLICGGDLDKVKRRVEMLIDRFGDCVE